MEKKGKVQYLVVDTSAFIQNAALQDIGDNIITEEEVVNEITNKRQLRRLVVLPYDLTVQQASPEDIKFVTEFAKRTGDYTSLSATDIKVIALTYHLEKEKMGTDHLRSAPIISKTMDSGVEQNKDLQKPLVGFYMPSEESELNNDDEEVDTSKEATINTKDNKECEENVLEDQSKKSDKCTSESLNDSGSDYETADSEIDDKITEDLSSKFTKLNCEPTEFIVQDENNSEHNVDDILPPIKNDISDENEYYESEDDENSETDDDNDDDDDGWITPKNLSAVKKKLDADVLEETPVTVACLTVDFAMQNVLKQIGLNVVALDGRLIKQMRTFIFRCYACFKTTSIMTKVFCPSCGNKTLKKVAVTLDQEGNQQILINFRRPISKKGKRFSLPMPKGGKHSNNPILVEDQPMPHQRPSRLARMKNDPMQDDYIAGYSPFITRDVHSKSAMLGIRTPTSFKNWVKKSTNESRRKRK